MINLFFYRLAVGAYYLGIRLFSLFNPKAKLFIDGRKGLLPLIKQRLQNEKRQRIWVHCASLGEFEQGRPVIEAIRQQHPEYCIVLTFFSPSGYEVRKNYAGADYVFYLPVDTPANAKSFLETVSPSLCVFIKYELWYFHLSGITKRSIPSVLVSAVFNDRQGFFKWYGGLQREMLQSFTRIFVQDKGSVDLLKGIDITNVEISGDTRFDRVIKLLSDNVDLEPAREFCAGHQVIVAGSTWKDDEVLLHSAISAMPENWRLLLVPHEVDSRHIDEIMQLFGSDITKWSGSEPNNKRVLLVDKVGMLSHIYKYGTLAWIGGGFGKAGVHNVLEPAVYGLPCYFGPVFHQFIEAIQLIEIGGAVVLTKPEELVKVATNDQRYQQQGKIAKEYVLSHGGATTKVMNYLKGLL